MTTSLKVKLPVRWLKIKEQLPKTQYSRSIMIHYPCGRCKLKPSELHASTTLKNDHQIMHDKWNDWDMNIIEHIKMHIELQCMDRMIYTGWAALAEPHWKQKYTTLPNYSKSAYYICRTFCSTDICFQQGSTYTDNRIRCKELATACSPRQHPVASWAVSVVSKSIFWNCVENQLKVSPGNDEVWLVCAQRWGLSGGASVVEGTVLETRMHHISTYEQDAGGKWRTWKLTSNYITRIRWKPRLSIQS